MNLDYFFFHLPTLDRRTSRSSGPTASGMSVLHHEPGPAATRSAPTGASAGLVLLGAAVAVLIPTLLYYGGGWLQYGYRYFLDSVPFVIALCGLAAVATAAGSGGVAGS